MVAGRLVTLCLLGCSIAPIDHEGKQCDDANECADGLACDPEGFCRHPENIIIECETLMPAEGTALLVDSENGVGFLSAPEATPLCLSTLSENECGTECRRDRVPCNELCAFAQIRDAMIDEFDPSPYTANQLTALATDLEPASSSYYLHVRWGSSLPACPQQQVWFDALAYNPQRFTGDGWTKIFPTDGLNDGDWTWISELDDSRGAITIEFGETPQLQLAFLEPNARCDRIVLTNDRNLDPSTLP